MIADEEAFGGLNSKVFLWPQIWRPLDLRYNLRQTSQEEICGHNLHKFIVAKALKLESSSARAARNFTDFLEFSYFFRIFRTLPERNWRSSAPERGAPIRCRDGRWKEVPKILVVMSLSRKASRAVNFPDYFIFGDGKFPGIPRNLKLTILLK